MPEVSGNTVAAGFIAGTALVSATGFVVLRLLDRRVTAWANVTDQDPA